MLLELSKYLIVTLLAATVCSAASLVPRYENDSDVDVSLADANAPAICTVSPSCNTLLIAPYSNRLYSKV